MATVLTRSDALGYYLSDPVGLGGARSALPFSGLDALISLPIPPLIVERVSPANGEGRGILLATGGDQVSWQAPGDDAGAAVTVALNARVLLESDDPAKSIRVFRDGGYSSANMEGQMLVDLVAGMHNAIGIGGLTVAGATQYGCVWLVNQSTSPITDVLITPGSGYSVGLETPSGGVVQTIANTTTAPSAVSLGSSASIAYLAPGEARVLWFRRVVGATTVSAEASGSISVAWNWVGLSYTDVLSGKYRISDPSLARYELHVGSGGAPDFTTPVATSATLPFTYALSPGASYHWAVRARNAYDLESFNTVTGLVVVGSGGADETPVLTDPTVEAFTSRPGGAARLRLRYNGSADAVEADTWRLYVTSDGSDPDPDADTPSDTAMVVHGLARPSAEANIDLGPYAWGAVVKVVARVYSTTLDAESGNTTISSLTIDTQAPVGPHLLAVSLGEYRGVLPSVADGITYYDSPTDSVGVRILAGEAVLFSGSADLLRAERGGIDLSRLRLALKNVTHSAVGAATPIEVVSANEIYLNVGGVRRCKIDLVNNRMEAARFVQTATPIDLPVIGPVHMTGTATYLQVRDRYTGRWTPALMVEDDGTVTFTAPIYQEAA